MGGRRERLWCNGIVTAGILWLMGLSFVSVNSQSTANKNIYIYFFLLPQSLLVSPSNHPLTKKPKDSEYKIKFAITVAQLLEYLTGVQKAMGLTPVRDQ